MTPCTARDHYISVVQDSWKFLVYYASCLDSDDAINDLAVQIKVSRAVLRRKVQAIRFAYQSGNSSEEIIAAGQSVVLSRYADSRRKQAEKQRFIRWRVPITLADAIQSKQSSADQEESLQTRLVRVLGIRTSEELWDFLLSIFAELSDKEIQNLAGVERGQKCRPVIK